MATHVQSALLSAAVFVISFGSAQAQSADRAPDTMAARVLATVDPVGTITAQGSPAWNYTGRDERDRELEVIAVEIGQAEGRDPFLLVIHVMPTHLRQE